MTDVLSPKIAPKVAADMLAQLGMRCICVAPGSGDQHRVTIGGIEQRDDACTRIWFRSEREATKVSEAVFSRCQQARRYRYGGLAISLPHAEVVKLIREVSFSLAVTPIEDTDVATTFDSIRTRVEAALTMAKRKGAMKAINAQYKQQREAAHTAGTAAPAEYGTWLAGKLKSELARSPELARISRL
jgi:hypothetical protein